MHGSHDAPHRAPCSQAAEALALQAVNGESRGGMRAAVMGNAWHDGLGPSLRSETAAGGRIGIDTVPVG